MRRLSHKNNNTEQSIQDKRQLPKPRTDKLKTDSYRQELFSNKENIVISHNNCDDILILKKNHARKIRELVEQKQNEIKNLKAGFEAEKKAIITQHALEMQGKEEYIRNLEEIISCGSHADQANQDQGHASTHAGARKVGKQQYTLDRRDQRLRLNRRDEVPRKSYSIDVDKQSCPLQHTLFLHQHSILQDFIPAEKTGNNNTTSEKFELHKTAKIKASRKSVDFSTRRHCSSKHRLSPVLPPNIQSN